MKYPVRGMDYKCHLVEPPLTSTRREALYYPRVRRLYYFQMARAHLRPRFLPLDSRENSIGARNRILWPVFGFASYEERRQ